MTTTKTNKPYCRGKVSFPTTITRKEIKDGRECFYIDCGKEVGYESIPPIINKEKKNGFW